MNCRIFGDFCLLAGSLTAAVYGQGGRQPGAVPIIHSDQLVMGIAHRWLGIPRMWKGFSGFRLIK